MTTTTDPRAARTLAIGDIHGCLNLLENLAERVGFSEDDTIVTLGDYVDRGPDSAGVLDFLIDLGQRTRLVPLRGNHEIMMEAARQTPGEFAFWHRHGGEQTLQSYNTTRLDDSVPGKHWDLLANCRPYHESETHFFVHANALPDVALPDQPDAILYWQFFDDPAPHQSGKTMVCGHSAQRSGVPLGIGHAICIDTYAYGGGWLTCLDTESGVYWQVNHNGDLRTDEIAVPPNPDDQRRVLEPE